MGTYVLLVLLTGVMSTFLVGYAWRSFNLQERQVGYLTQASIAAGLIAPRLEEGQEAWSGLLSDLAGSAGVRILVTDQVGTVLADTSPGSEFLGQRLGRREVNQALSGQKGATVSRLTTGEPVMYVAVPIHQQRRVVGSVFMASDVGDIYASGRTLEGWMILTTLGGAALAAALGLAFSRAVTAPLERLQKASGDLARGDFNARVPEEGGPEIRDLSLAFNRMARALEEVDSSRRLFAAGAAHELKSPLASIKAMTESLLDRPQVEENLYREFLTDIQREADRLTHMTESLLVLARLEQGRAVLRPACLSLEELVEQAVGNLASRAREKEVRLLVGVQETQAWLDGELAELAVGNLLDNAIKYSSPGQEVTVRAGPSEKGVFLQVEDQGPGVDPQELGRIFDRFYRPDQARARGTGGAGLGLALVREVAELHDGWVQAERAQGGGLQVTMWFPGPP